MNDLLRSTTDVSMPQLGRAPSVPKSDGTARVLSQLSALAAGGVQLYQKEHEAAMERQAKNDIVNNTINPDLVQNEGAYAVAVTKNDAREKFLDMKQRVLSGEFDELSPEDYQKQINDFHISNKDSFKSSDYSELMSSAYDDFWSDNEMTLTAGQAGKYRVKMREKTAQALLSGMISMAKTGEATTDSLIKLSTQPEYQLLNDDEIADATLLLGVDLANEMPELALKILPELNQELGYDLNPTRSKAYRAAITTARTNYAKKQKLANRLEENTIRAEVEEIVDSGGLTTEMYQQYAGKTDANGNPYYTAKEWQSRVAASKKIKAKNDALNTAKMMYAGGQDISGITTQKDFDQLSSDAYTIMLAGSNNDPIKAYENMGRLLINQTKQWSFLKNRAEQFSRVEMLHGNTVNQDAIKRYKELSALERGLMFHANGENVFASYLGDALAQYKEVKDGLAYTQGSEEDVWNTIAMSVSERKKTAARTNISSKFSVTAKTLAANVANDVWGETDKWWIPDFIETAMVPTTGKDRVAFVAAQTYDRKIAEGFPADTAKYTAEVTARRQTRKWAGEIYDTHGEELSAIFGTSDPEGAFKTMLNDPQWNNSLKEMFGVTYGEMFFGREQPVKPEDIREYEQKRAESKLYLSTANIRKEINMDKGTLDFKSPDGEGTVLSIPLRDIGALHNAKMQGIDNIQQLPRLYGEEYQATEAGKQWAASQQQENNLFMQNVLETPAATGRTTITRQEYVDMTPEEQTRTRLQFHKDNYDGATGRVKQIIDWFGSIITNEEPAFLIPTKELKSMNIEQGSIEHKIITAIPKAEGTNKYAQHGYKSAYDVTLGYGIYDKKGLKPLTEMTLQEAYDAGEARRKNPKNKFNSSAMGAYQITSQTLKDVYKIAGLKMSDKMTPENQDKLAVAILKQSGLEKFKSGKISAAAFNKRMKGRWQGFEVHPELIDSIIS